MKTRVDSPGVKFGFALFLTMLGSLFFWHANSQAAAFLNVDVIGQTTNAVAGSALNLGTLDRRDSLYLLPYYLRVQFPLENSTAWGIQLYTNNNPERSWVPTDGVHGGLRGTIDPLQRILLYWQVYSAPQTNTITAEGLGFYPATLPNWGRVIDQNDSDVSLAWGSLANYMRRTLVSYLGLGDFPRTHRSQVSSPVYVYLGMNLGTVTQPQTFGTTLRVDLYNLGVGPSQGGFATPNPFTPVTGQRTNFNFFLRDINSSFMVRIYSLRGRQVRALTNIREWDGRNESGQLVEGGVYIFQIEAEKERISGTVVVIK